MEFGLEHFCIDAEVDNDFYAIALEKSGSSELRAYIYIYGQSGDNYGIHLEYPRFIEQSYSDSMLIYEELSIQTVINTIATHFELAA